MIIQTFKTSCENCEGGEAFMALADMTGKNEIILDFIDGEGLVCSNCGATTYIEINKNCVVDDE